MGQKVRRHRPAIHSQQLQVKRDEYPTCSMPGCRNVVARWSKYKICSRCRS